MTKLYGPDDEIPDAWADDVLDDEKPVGPADDDETATADVEGDAEGDAQDEPA
jgi:hypothetical protein